MPGSGNYREADPTLGTRDGGLGDDACYRVYGPIVAKRATRADGSTVESGVIVAGLVTSSYCDAECGALPEPFPTGFFNRVVI